MKNISLNFFGEEVSINMPTDLASLRQQISEKYMFSPSDAAEIVVSYAKDLGKIIIQTEQDFVKFISDKINKIDLDISQDSQLFKKNFNTLQKETDDNKKKLDEALKKRDEIKKKRETALKTRTDEIKKLEEKIQQIKNEKKKIQQLSKKEEKEFGKQEHDLNKKIHVLQEKLGLNKKLKSKNPNQIKNMINECFESKNEEYKKLDKLPLGIVENINKIIKPIIEHKLKKLHEIEKHIKHKKTELKPEERDFLMNFPLFCNDIYKKVDSFSNYIQCETQRVVSDIQKAIKNQKDIVCPPRKKINKESKHFYQECCENYKKKENTEGKAIHHGYICDGCQMAPIIGNRYNCTICKDFDYCDACEEKFKNEHKHPFLKIYKPSK